MIHDPDDIPAMDGRLPQLAVSIRVPPIAEQLTATTMIQ
jgi:hypothetical protein